MFLAACREEDSSDCVQPEWVSFEELHPEQYWSVSQLEPADLATAFGAGFISLGTILIVAKSISVVLSMLK